MRREIRQAGSSICTLAKTVRGHEHVQVQTGEMPIVPVTVFSTNYDVRRQMPSRPQLTKQQLPR